MYSKLQWLAGIVFLAGFVLVQAEESPDFGREMSHSGYISGADDAGAGQEESDLSTDYYKYYDEGWTLRPNISYRQFSFNLTNTDTGRDIQYVPNVNGNVGFGFLYRTYGLGFSTAIPQPEDPQKGESKYVDFQFYFPLGKHGIDLIYQHYKGFYVNDEDLKTDGEYLQYPDLVGFTTDITYSYVFNRDFSLKAAFNQTERQLENAGSWIISTSLNALVIGQEGDGFVPSAYASDFPELDGLQAMYFNGLSIAGGYGYTFVKENLYFTPAFLFGTNIENQVYNISGGEYTQKVFFNPKSTLKVSFGSHNDKRFFGTTVMINTKMALTTEAVQFSISSLNVNFFYGIRI